MTITANQTFHLQYEYKKHLPKMSIKKREKTNTHKGKTNTININQADSLAKR